MFVSLLLVISTYIQIDTWLPQSGQSQCRWYWLLDIGYLQDHGSGFNASVKQPFHFFCESQQGWGRGEGRVRGGGIRWWIQEQVVNMLTLMLWGSVLCVRLHHPRPGRWMSQAGPRIVCYLKSTSVWAGAIFAEDRGSTAATSCLCSSSTQHEINVWVVMG